MKNIKSRIVAVICILVALSLGFTGTFVGIAVYSGTLRTLEDTLTETAKVTASYVVNALDGYKLIAAETGAVARLSNPESSIADKKLVIDNKIQQYGFLYGNIADANGKALFSDENVSDREYFKAAMAGNATVSDVVLSRTINKYGIVVAAPLWDKGLHSTTIVGVVYFLVDPIVLDDIVRAVQVGETGTAYVIDKSGYTIAHNTIALETRNNTQESVKTAPNLKELAALEADMMKGSTGFGSYSLDGERKLLAYVPIDNGNGWSIGVTCAQNEFLKGLIDSIYVIIGAVILFMIIGVIVAFKLGNAISRPLKEIELAADSLANGKLDVTVTYTGKDELGSLANSMREATSKLRIYVDDISYILAQLAKGSFVLRSPQQPFIGDFAVIETSTRQMIVDMTDTLSQIGEAAQQVSGGSEQVSSGAQALAQGATEQASSIEELSASIIEIADQVKQNAENSKNASDFSHRAAEAINNSNEQMRQLIKSMTDIDDKSNEISKIIKTIEDIAFQTNILALNAAVEAARAGSAGKGFAVVADEVRNLAGKSAEAAKNTTQLIESSVSAIAAGVALTNHTATQLNTAVADVASTKDIIDLISVASGEQAQAIEQITIGIDQVSAVVQTNSATSEESAAASQELSNQANLLKNLISKFELPSVGGHAPISSVDYKPTPAIPQKPSVTSYKQDYTDKY